LETPNSMYVGMLEYFAEFRSTIGSYFPPSVEKAVEEKNIRAKSKYKGVESDFIKRRISRCLINKIMILTFLNLKITNKMAIDLN